MPTKTLQSFPAQDPDTAATQAMEVPGDEAGAYAQPLDPNKPRYKGDIPSFPSWRAGPTDARRNGRHSPHANETALTQPMAQVSDAVAAAVPATHPAESNGTPTQAEDGTFNITRPPNERGSLSRLFARPRQAEREISRTLIAAPDNRFEVYEEAYVQLCTAPNAASAIRLLPEYTQFVFDTYYREHGGVEALRRTMKYFEGVNKDAVQGFFQYCQDLPYPHAAEKIGIERRGGLGASLVQEEIIR